MLTDGLLVSWAENCDDNNTLSGDGCDSSCEVESGYACAGGSLSASDSCSTICGGAVMEPNPRLTG